MTAIVPYLLVALVPAITLSLLVLVAGATLLWSADPPRRERAEWLVRLVLRTLSTRRRR